MRVSDVMTPNPASCRADDPIASAAKLMVKYDCGFVPVYAGSEADRRLSGVITDRDIACRCVAAELDPRSTKVDACMTSPVITIREDASVDDCIELMEQHKIRRLVVLDDEGELSGVIAEADLARAMRPEDVGELERIVSEPGTGPSLVQ